MCVYYYLNNDTYSEVPKCDIYHLRVRLYVKFEMYCLEILNMILSYSTQVGGGGCGRALRTRELENQDLGHSTEAEKQKEQLGWNGLWYFRDL